MTEAEKILRFEITTFDHNKEDKEMIPYNDAIKAVEKALKQGQSLPIDSVRFSLPSELEAHAQATKLYQDEDYGDAKYDGYMKCYRELVKGNKVKRV